MLDEPIVSLELAQALKAVGAPQTGDHRWVRINQAWHLWCGSPPYMLVDEAVATYTLGKIIAALGEDLSQLSRCDTLPGRPWAARGAFTPPVAFGVTPLEAVARLWLIVLEAWDNRDGT